MKIMKNAPVILSMLLLCSLAVSGQNAALKGSTGKATEPEVVAEATANTGTIEKTENGSIGNLLQIQDASGNAGKVATVRALLTVDQDVYGAQFDLIFDQNKLQIKTLEESGVTTGADAGGLTLPLLNDVVLAAANSTGRLGVIMVDLNVEAPLNAGMEKELLKVNFTIDENAAGGDEVPITIGNSSFATLLYNVSTLIPVDTQEGKVTIVKFEKGDVSGDGEVNIFDLLDLLKVLSGFGSARGAILGRSNADVIKTLKIVNGVVVYLPEQAVEALSREQGVVLVAPDVLVEPTGKPQKPPKPEKSDQEIPWGVDRIDADAAWSTSTGSGVKVAILDTGIDGTHEDLIVAGGINVTDVGGPNDYDVDNNGHGTHLAGTVAALDNKVGVVGVAPDAELYAVKFRDTMYGWASDAIDGIQWCIDNDMDVINMSFTMGVDEEGVPYDPPGFHDAIIAAYNNAGITMVCAPGNDVTNPVGNPAAYSETICTAGIYETGPKKRRTAHSFGTTGPEVDLASPGCDILSTFPLALDVNDGEQDGYTEKGCGTSMSAAHGSGVAALVLELNLSMSPDNVKTLLKTTAEDIGLSQEEQGAGLIDAEAAVQ